MDILKLDLEKYKKWLWELSEELESYEIVKSIKGGVFTVDSLVLEKWKELYNRYLGYVPERLGLNYFLPTKDEREEMEHLLINALEEDKEGFAVLCSASALPSEVLKDRRLSELAYHFTGFYIEGEPIQMYKRDREEIFIKFFQDLYRFRFARYLQSLDSDGQNEIGDSILIKDVSDVLGVLERVGVIDGSGKILIKKNGSSILNGVVMAFIESEFFKIGTPKRRAFNSVAKVIGFKGVMPKNPNEPQPIEVEMRRKVLEVIKVGNSGK